MVMDRGVKKHSLKWLDFALTYGRATRMPHAQPQSSRDGLSCMNSRDLPADPFTSHSHLSIPRLQH